MSSSIHKFFSIIFLGLLGCGQGVFEISSTNMEPSLRVGDKVIIVDTGFDRGDIVAYRMMFEDQEQIWVSRVVANSGDTLEIKSGEIFVDGIVQTYPVEIQYSYSVTANRTIPESRFEDWEVTEYYKGSTGYLLHTNSRVASNLRRITGVSQVKKEIQPSVLIDQDMHSSLPRGNRDHLKQIVIPEGHVFVVGDNRHNSMDSRHHGFVKIEDITGTVQ